MAETMAVRIRYVDGHVREVELTDQGRFDTPGSRLEQQLVRTATDTVLIRKYVPRAEGRARPHLYDLLDREIRADARLLQVYGPVPPPELPTLVAYNVDAEEPFALLRPYESEPVTDDLLSRLVDDKEAPARFRASLVRALLLTGRAGVVHGEVTFKHLRWTGTHVQLVDFEHSRCADLRRSERPVLPRVDVRDDLPQAGEIIRRLALGVSDAGLPADHARDPEHLRALLEGVFRKTEQRPYARDLLDRMQVDTSLPPLKDPEHDLRAGWRLFDEMSTTGTAEATIPPPRSGWRRRILGLMLLATLAAGVARR